MGSEELVEGISAVGCTDWSVRDFHSFEITKGTTYNSFLICDQKNALIDTVKAPFADRFLRNLREKIDLAKIDYLVCNHLEPDHAGALPTVMKALPHVTLLCNAKCRAELNGYFQTDGWNIRTITPGDSVSLGTRSLTFVNTPMVHWPESMVTYCPEESILFSSDAFGQHLATGYLFDDQFPCEEQLTEAKNYFANIVAPCSRQVLKTLDTVSTLGLKMIAPSHGLIWRSRIADILSAYRDWASGKYAARVVLLFDSMWESTTRMAEEIQRGIRAKSESVEVVLLHVRRNPLSRIALNFLDAPCVAVGSPTLNAEMMPWLSAALTYIKGLKFRPKHGIAFGSTGWGPGGVESVARWFEEAKYTLLSPAIRAMFRPDDAILDSCRAAGALLAEKALETAE